MYDMGTRERVLALMAQNRSLNSVSRETGISRAAIRSWQRRSTPLRTIDCPRCQAVPGPPRDPAAYAYLLGLYLGDGCVSPLKRGVHSLRIACAEAWPGLIDACAEAMRSVMPGNKVCQVRQQGCRQVTSCSKHWPCLFPQHGPGKKHERPIVLEPWQRDIVDAHPWAFVRGLVHSDGCRVTNWTTRTVRGELRRYEYPRYFFTNRSDDILGLFTAALDRVGVEWKRAKRKNISVARKASVALMDIHVGAKY